MQFETLPENWDLIVIGGGITGAGILREAVRMGAKTLLIEQNDFAWGTSSRSSKLVHGGLRYLKEGRLRLTYESVQQRQRLIKEAPGLVEELGFLMPIYENMGPGKTFTSVGLKIYDLMAGHRYHCYCDNHSMASMIPRLNTDGLEGGFCFMDAQVDDVRLVLRLIFESIENGGAALNYTRVKKVLRNLRGNVCGVAAEDTEKKTCRIFTAPCVINATGSWAEALHPSPTKGLHLRPLRGSHLILPGWRLPLTQAVTLIHPRDGRPLFLIPWEGGLLLGTTDIDHGNDISGDIVMSREEAAYMMECLQSYFPGENLGLGDCVSSYAGIRPVLSRKDCSPSKESRDHMVWSDSGLVTVTGGKLTTFRYLAADALKAAADRLPQTFRLHMNAPAFKPALPCPEDRCGLTPHTWRRLYGRYGVGAEKIVKSAAPDDLSIIPGTFTLWAELPVLAKREQVRHLTDLLMRRVRVGLLVPGGGRKYLDRIQALCEPALDWDGDRWRKERLLYIKHWDKAHSVPGNHDRS